MYPQFEGSFGIVKGKEKFDVFLTIHKRVFAIDKVNPDGTVSVVGRVRWKEIMEFAALPV